MNKYFKKFSIMFLMLLAVIGCGVVRNETVANAATVGQQLTSPEPEWTRFQFGDPYIQLQGNWSSGYTRDTSSTIKFKFYGNSFRIISFGNIDWSNEIEISIDGKVGSFSEYSASAKSYLLVFQSDKLENESHTVSMHNKNDGMAWHIQAIDINKGGHLLLYDESISLDSTSMSLKVDDSKQLTATTTPAGLDVTWTSSDSNVAEYDSATGKVIAKGVGTCIIKATINDGSNLSANCEVTVTEGTIDPPPVDPPNEPSGDANLLIELEDGNIKTYSVTSEQISNFIAWYKNRDNDDSESPIYKFTKGDYKDYVVHDKIVWFEVR